MSKSQSLMSDRRWDPEDFFCPLCLLILLFINSCAVIRHFTENLPMTWFCIQTMVASHLKAARLGFPLKGWLRGVRDVNLSGSCQRDQPGHQGAPESPGGSPAPLTHSAFHLTCYRTCRADYIKHSGFWIHKPNQTSWLWVKMSQILRLCPAILLGLG